MRHHPGPCCGVRRTREALDPDATAAFDRSLASDVAGSDIAHALRAEGFRLSPFTVQHHRRGFCCCTLHTERDE